MECYYIIKQQGYGEYYLHTDNKFYLGAVNYCGISPKRYMRESCANKKLKQIQQKYSDNSIKIKAIIL